MITGNGTKNNLLVWSRTSKNKGKNSGKRNDKKTKIEKKTSKDKNNKSCMVLQQQEASWLPVQNKPKSIYLEEQIIGISATMI